MQNNIQQEEIDGSLNIQDLLYLCLSKWKWFVLSVVVCLGAGYFYLLKTPSVYTRSAELLIKREYRGRSITSDIEGFDNFGLFRSATNINNELVALKSPAVMTEVVKRLRLDMNYYAPGRFHDNLLYGMNLPFKANIEGLSENMSAEFIVNINRDGKMVLSGFKLKGEELKGAAQVTGKFPGSVKTPVGNITFEKMPGYVPGDDYTVRVVRSGLYGTVGACSSRLSVALNDEESTVLTLKYSDVSPARAEDILNSVIAVYNENWVQDKNQIAVSTSLFINDRLAVIESELGNVDENISSFKSENLVPDVKTASSLYLSQSTQTSSQILDLNTQLSMARYIRNYLAATANRNQLLPANSGLESSGIEAQISEYNTLQLQRNNLVANSSEENPLVMDLDHSLSTIRGAIISSIENLEVTLNTRIRDLQRSERQTTSRIAANPNQAKYLLSVERQQKVKEALYLFLLQKREENELSQAFTAYNSRVITPPSGSSIPTSPVRRNILLAALVLGLCIPGGIIFLLETMNTKIRGRKDLERLTLPFAGEIPLYGEKKKKGVFAKKDKKENKAVVVKDGKRDLVNEAFRVLRTNVEFMAGDEKGSKVIILTSYNPGSGKTFLTMNLAASLAIKGKKVLVIDGDLRHGSSSAYIGSPSKGLSNYLAEGIQDANEVILPFPGYDNMFVLPVGIIPPNPTELLEKDRLVMLMEKLRKEFDYILVDCPPVELVADTQIIESMADRTIFVVRAGLLERSMLNDLENLYKNKKFKNMALVLNGTEVSSGYGKYGHGYRYAYHYGYGYGYAYGAEKKS